MVPTVMNFCFGYFTFQNQIDARITSMVIWRQTHWREFVIRSLRHQRRHNVHGKCLFRSVNLKRTYVLRKVFRHRSFVKCNVFMSQSFHCRLYKFRTVKTLSRTPSCADSFTNVRIAFKNEIFKNFNKLFQIATCAKMLLQYFYVLRRWCSF